MKPDNSICWVNVWSQSQPQPTGQVGHYLGWGGSFVKRCPTIVLTLCCRRAEPSRLQICCSTDSNENLNDCVRRSRQTSRTPTKVINRRMCFKEFRQRVEGWFPWPCVKFQVFYLVHRGFNIIRQNRVLVCVWLCTIFFFKVKSSFLCVPPQASVTSTWTTRWRCCSARGSSSCLSASVGDPMSSATATCSASRPTSSSTSKSSG